MAAATAVMALAATMAAGECRKTLIDREARESMHARRRTIARALSMANYRLHPSQIQLNVRCALSNCSHRRLPVPRLSALGRLTASIVSA